VAKERNNIYAVTADAVDLALDTAGTIGSMVGSIANAVGLGDSGKEKSEDHQRRQADDAAKRVSKSLHQEAEAVKPRSHKVHAAKKHVSKTRTAKKAARPRTARKAS
jgi:hypothetical protein